jgi:hypothetical protein
MKVNEMSDYEKYLLIADSTHSISGGYQGFVNFREVIGIIRTMFSKQSKITISEMGTILNSFDLGVFRKGFNSIRSIANQIGIGRI